MHHYEPTKMRSSPTLAPRYCLPAVWSLIVLLKSGMCDSYYKVLTGTVELKFTKIMAGGVAPGRTARWFTPAHAVALFTMVHRPFASVFSASFGGAPVSIGDPELLESRGPRSLHKNWKRAFVSYPRKWESCEDTVRGADIILIGVHVMCYVAFTRFFQVSTLNFIDRGIIAGAGTTIMGCLPSGDHCEVATAVPCPGRKAVPWNCTSTCRVCGAICDGKEVRGPHYCPGPMNSDETVPISTEIGLSVRGNSNWIRDRHRDTWVLAIFFFSRILGCVHGVCSSGP